MYTIFNPWKGFPSYKAVYLDIDFQRMRANGQEAYGTAQTAYDAAVAMGGDVVIMVGNIDAGTSGNIVLTGDYDNNVSWVGLHKDRSRIGSIDVNHASVVAGKDIEIKISNLSFEDIDSSYTGNVPGTSGGNIVITSFNPCDIDNIISSSSGGSGGNIQTTGEILVGTLINASGTGVASIGGDIDIGENSVIEDIISTALDGGNIIINKNCIVNGSIDTSGGLGGGDVEIRENTNVFGSISTFGSSTTGGQLTLKSCFVHDIFMFGGGGANPDRILCNNSVIEGLIDAVVNKSVFNNTTFISLFSECIQDVLSNTPQFNNCVFISALGSNSINAGSLMNIIANNTLQNNDFGANVNVLVGNNNVTNALFVSPLP